MKAKNSLGFTLIELIATITILGIIMLIAVPNVISVVTKNKNQTYVNDARKFVTLAKYKFESDANIMRPTSTNCAVIMLSSVDRSELQSGPEDGTYETDSNATDQSYVVIKYENSTYVYYVQLIETYSNKNNTVQKKGIALMKYDDLVQIDAKNSAIKTSGWINTGSMGATTGCTNSDIYE
ncbi:MAG: type II secretion system protein [Clostridium sp.]|jgi:prepilin-type cleavage/methylation N-terminal domain protein|nr:type II secretion system protein [Clostridium sp.]